MSRRSAAYVTGLNNAFRAGRQAARAGVSNQNCPYTRADMVKCWEDGWIIEINQRIKRKKKRLK